MISRSLTRADYLAAIDAGGSEFSLTSAPAFDVGTRPHGLSVFMPPVDLDASAFLSPLPCKLFLRHFQNCTCKHEGRCPVYPVM